MGNALPICRDPHVIGRRPAAVVDVLGEPGQPLAVLQLRLSLDQRLAGGDGVGKRCALRCLEGVVLGVGDAGEVGARVRDSRGYRGRWSRRHLDQCLRERFHKRKLICFRGLERQLEPLALELRRPR